VSELEGTALVTGGTGALGEAVVRDLLNAGAKVTATWILESERERIEEALGGEEGLGLVQADLLSEEGARAAVEATGPELGALVSLVGGYGGSGRLHEAPLEEFDRMMALNLTTALNITRAALPGMVEARAGAIVCVGTRAALEPFSGAAGYAVSKAAVVALVRSIAVEYRDDGIRANAVLPSVIDTPGNRESMPDADHDTWVPPAQIARVIRFLCSSDSAPISGAEVPVYGRA
jgi:NAD(P)-dependent dehydrogenase (short-subunit alcohol dehydrogenase family)